MTDLVVYYEYDQTGHKEEHMTDVMQLLFDHTMETSFTKRLGGDPAYRRAKNLVGRLEDTLRRSLSAEGQDTLEQYQDALAEREDLELEAMFLCALDLARELR